MHSIVKDQIDGLYLIDSVVVDVEEKKRELGIYTITDISIESKAPYETKQKIEEQCFNSICEKQYNWSEQRKIKEVIVDVRAVMEISDSVEVSVMFPSDYERTK